jgi:hypothetical protein
MFFRSDALCQPRTERRALFCGSVHTELQNQSHTEFGCSISIPRNIDFLPLAGMRWEHNWLAQEMSKPLSSALFQDFVSKSEFDLAMVT